MNQDGRESWEISVSLRVQLAANCVQYMDVPDDERAPCEQAFPPGRGVAGLVVG